MKSVMISIKPKWCELIASGKKTIEVRKTRPKIETPFKCYIYCTNDFADSRTRRKRSEFWIGEPLNNVSKGRYIGNGMVIGEFICDFYETIAFSKSENGIGFADCISEYLTKDACLTKQQAFEYSKSNPTYGWHISDLVIYDKPKELSEFYKPCTDPYQYCQGCKHGLVQYPADVETSEDLAGCCFDTVCLNKMTRPPQSWCYCGQTLDWSDTE